MRTYSLALLSALGLAALAACSSGQDDAASSESAATEEEDARGALRVLGAKLQNEERSDATCYQCHDPNKMTLKGWADDYKKTLAFLQDESKTVDERIDFMRRDPADKTSSFAPKKLGVLTAGTHFTTASVNEQRHPTLFKITKVLAKLFEGKADMYRQFKLDTLMPIEASYDRLSPAEFEKIVSWVDKGMPKLEELLVEEPRPTSCTDDFSALKDHVRSVKSTNWMAVNQSQRVPMFACSSDNALECFNQQFKGKAIFPESRTTTYAKNWAVGEDNHRVLRVLEYKTKFWMRTSADGRFVGNGGGPNIDGTGSVMADLGAALDPGGPKTRDIGINASYDPDFFPANQGFMFQGGAKFCALSLLKKPETTKVTFSEPECSTLESVGLYQTVGQVSGDNSISDIFAVNSKNAADNPGLTASDKDHQLTAGPEASVVVHVGVARGNDAEEGYQMRQHVTLPTPFKGDTMMSRTGQLLGSRVAGENGALGYAIDKVTFSPGGDGYRFTLKGLGRICMPGNKANFSFDERFLTTHHYLTREDFDSDDAFAAYKDKGAADIYVADFVTGKKLRVTHMAPGQFALFPHFRSDGWLYYLVRDANTKQEYIVASDTALKATQASPL